ncbi:helix-turn-helix domain-containing protein [Streptomyces avermitilis]
MSWAGQRVPAIADELRCNQRTIRRWLHRFNRLGLDLLEDLGGQRWHAHGRGHATNGRWTPASIRLRLRS